MARAELLEKRPTWGGGKRWVTTMSLEPLSEVESQELVTSLLGRAELPTEFRTHISQAAEGNPLFVEELLGQADRRRVPGWRSTAWSAPGDLRQLALPPTIQALLAARLDGLGSEERAVIERAAVEGKVFHRGAVTEMAPEPIRPQVRDRLASLMRMELVRPDQASFAGEEAYRFRHLLIRDAAYQALAKQTRSELHERFAAWLERVVGERLAEYEEIIAYHLEQAYRYRVELGPPDSSALDLASQAAGLLASAGRRADQHNDAHAARGLLERALDLLPEDASRRLAVAVDLARVLHYCRGGAPRGIHPRRGHRRGEADRRRVDRCPGVADPARDPELGPRGSCDQGHRPVRGPCEHAGTPGRQARRVVRPWIRCREFLLQGARCRSRATDLAPGRRSRGDRLPATVLALRCHFLGADAGGRGHPADQGRDPPKRPRRDL